MCKFRGLWKLTKRYNPTGCQDHVNMGWGALEANDAQNRCNRMRMECLDEGPRSRGIVECVRYTWLVLQSVRM